MFKYKRWSRIVVIQAVAADRDDHLHRSNVSLMSRFYRVIDVNLNEQVLSTIERLRPAIINHRIFFSLIMFADLWKISIEPEECQKTLTALLAESCKSLPGGGRITIETANRCLSSSDILDGRQELIPGEYVMLSLSDTGSSLSTAANLRFIKTLHLDRGSDNKPEATAVSIYNFIRRSGGNIVRHNGQGPGTTVSLYFPRYTKQAAISSTLPLGDSSSPISKPRYSAL